MPHPNLPSPPYGNAQRRWRLSPTLCSSPPTGVPRLRRAILSGTPEETTACDMMEARGVVVERLIEQSLGKDERQTLFLSESAHPPPKPRPLMRTTTRSHLHQRALRGAQDRQGKGRRRLADEWYCRDTFCSSSLWLRASFRPRCERGLHRTGLNWTNCTVCSGPSVGRSRDSRVVKFCTVVRCCGLGCDVDASTGSFCACAAREPPINTGPGGTSVNSLTWL